MKMMDVLGELYGLEGQHEVLSAREIAVKLGENSKAVASEIHRCFKSLVREGHAKLAQKGTGLLVTLETGYVASTRDPQLVDALKRHEATGTSIELTCRPSNDPSKYAPVIVEMATQVRE